MTDLALLKPTDFEPLCGCAVAVEGVPVTLTLDNVKEHGPHTRRDGHIEIGGRVLPPRQAFALVLEGPREPLLGQGTYGLDFPGLGTLGLFMVPFRQDATCTLYEITFN